METVTLDSGAKDRLSTFDPTQFTNFTSDSCMQVNDTPMQGQALNCCCYGAAM
jgi:hypothetical protein